MKRHLPYVVTLFALFLGSLTICFAENSDNIVRYSQFGAVGDGKTDDFDAIVKAHEAANAAGKSVQADPQAVYYIGGGNKTAVVQTDTDWGDAKFIIDDTKVENRNRAVFDVTSRLPVARIKFVKSLKKDQTKIDFGGELPGKSLISVTDKNTLRFIRYGLNQNNGTAQTDVFLVDKDGTVDMTTPIIWDFDTITSLEAYPVDEQTLTLSGGHFTTIANQEESRYAYYSRGIRITRSNVVVDALKHDVTGELDSGAPYGGFITVSLCANVTVQNCTLTGHKIYRTMGRGGGIVSMGTYDISVNRAINTTFRNCRQFNDINDNSRWGIFGSNFCKNILFDNVEFSRFDAHMGVASATIRNSKLGHQGINLIGTGTFLIENSTASGGAFINLRGDYGSFFDGDIVIRNCRFVPRNGAKSEAVIVGGSYSGQHDFGYVCRMPHKITIDGLDIQDVNVPNNYQGPKIFGNFNSKNTSEQYVETYPYVITEEVEICNLKTQSGKPYSVSFNPYMFRNVKITEKK